MSSKNILIADDYACIRSLLRSSIEGAGFTVCGEARNGREAIALALQSRPDLIVLDLAMPEMNGAEAAPVLKQRLPDVPIIIFSLYADEVVDDLRRALNVERVISKLHGINAVMDSITALLGPSELHTARSARKVKRESLSESHAILGQAL